MLFLLFSALNQHILCCTCVEHEEEVICAWMKQWLCERPAQLWLRVNYLPNEPMRLYTVSGTPLRFDVSGINEKSFSMMTTFPRFHFASRLHRISNFFLYRQCRWIQMFDGSGVSLSSEKTDNVLEMLDIARCWKFQLVIRWHFYNITVMGL